MKITLRLVVSIRPSKPVLSLVEVRTRGYSTSGVRSTYMSRFAIKTSNSKSKILAIAERGDFARFLNPSTNFSRMLECRGANSFTLAPDLLSKSCVRCSAGVRGLFVDGWRLKSPNRELSSSRFGIAASRQDSLANKTVLVEGRVKTR